MTFRALKIENCQLSEVQLAETTSASDDLHRIIGNWFTTAFSTNPYSRHNITGFCDDEGLLTGRAFEAVMGPMLRMDMQPIAGPIVIVGGTAEGETRSLTDNEVKNFALLDNEAVGLSSLMQVGRVLPVLVYDPKLYTFATKAEREERLMAVDRALAAILAHVQHDALDDDLLARMIDAS